MRLFKRGKDKGDSSKPDTPSASDNAYSTAENDHSGSDGNATPALQQQLAPTERSQKFGRGMHAVMNKPTKPVNNQDYIQASIGALKRDQMQDSGRKQNRSELTLFPA